MVNKAWLKVVVAQPNRFPVSPDSGFRSDASLHAPSLASPQAAPSLAARRLSRLCDPSVCKARLHLALSPSANVSVCSPYGHNRGRLWVVDVDLRGAAVFNGGMFTVPELLLFSVYAYHVYRLCVVCWLEFLSCCVAQVGLCLILLSGVWLHSSTHI